MKFFVVIPVIFLLTSLLSCRTTSLSSVADSPTVGRPPLLPSAVGSGDLSPWGGSNQANWREEAILANATSSALNEAWALADVRDVLVAVPVKFIDSGFRPYGDGQSNAMAVFSGWTQKRPPLVSSLIHFRSAPSSVLIKFDRAWNLTQTSIEVRFRTESGQAESVFIPAARNSDGDLVGRWDAIPSVLEWGKLGHVSSVLMRPSPNFNDWLPISFRHPVKRIEDLLATVPANQQKFSDGTSIVDHESLEQESDTEPTPFEKALNHSFASMYNQSPYNPPNIHGEYGPGGTTTSVGQGWTWVAEQNAPFKIMYTCFQRRQPTEEAANHPGPYSGGVASGGGWHQIGDPAETILNSLERQPLVVASGFANIAKRTNFMPPPGSGFAYGLSDIAVVRWLYPGEAFVTAKGLSEANFHWYYFQQDREICTEEWVHPCRPMSDDHDFRCN